MIRIIFLFVSFNIFSCSKEEPSEPARADARPIISIFPADNPASESAVEASAAPESEKVSGKSESKKYSVTSDINVRKAGDNKSVVVRKLKKGTEVICLKLEPKGWCALEGGGFAAMKFLKVVK